MTDLRAVLPKPKSVRAEARHQVEAEGHACDTLSRELFSDTDRAVRYIETRAAGRPVVLFDVGGRTSAGVGELQTEEVTAAAWRDAETIADETLRTRVRQALR
ncbi:hypothetical protein ACH4RA_32525 [Streptomyces smyrnaeus]|uniref:hypothetical protein n=1 Tax=Streptomyces smyrnaeus TaxID=1387713 RepID=UPI0016167208